MMDHINRAERAHQTVLRIAKASILDSKLPLIYFSDAHRMATFQLNRKKIRNIH
jgi:hypothetical protein